MSLTRHLDNRQSPVYQFMRDAFPDLGWFVRSQNSSLLDGSTQPMDIPAGDCGAIGMALDYRLRYYFAVTPSQNLIAAEGAELATMVGCRSSLVDEFFASLDAFLSNVKPSRRRLNDDQESQLVRYSIVLAWFEQIYRAWNSVGSDSLKRSSPLFHKRTLSALLEAPHPDWVRAVCDLSARFYDHHADLVAKPAWLNPVFEGSPDVGGADADLIVDGCLIDFKAAQRLDGQALYQVLGYLLLDYSDRYHLKAIGIYFARQAILAEWRILEADRLALMSLRTRMRNLLRRTAEIVMCFHCEAPCPPSSANIFCQSCRQDLSLPRYPFAFLTEALQSTRDASAERQRARNRKNVRAWQQRNRDVYLQRQREYQRRYQQRHGQ